MSKNIDIEILETAEYGVILRCHDMEIADKFEDFLTEQRFVLFNIRPEGDDISFLFGQASTPVRVQDLYDQFSRKALQ